MTALGEHARLEGVDLPSRAPTKRYRDLIGGLASYEHVLGAVITSHKIPVFSACSDLFVEIEDAAARTAECNCIYKVDRGLAAGARDPEAIASALGQILGDSDQRPGEVLCLGAGGAATALALYLLDRDVRAAAPWEVTFTDVRREQLDALAAKAGTFGAGATTRFVLVETLRDTDVLLESMPPGSLVVNATGLGKDALGSPISQIAAFPEQALVWELNYRGELAFLRQAFAQRSARRLRVHDGWMYFLNGWYETLTTILNVDRGEAPFGRFAEASMSHLRS